jgi:site-specific DNA recombinase
VADACRANWNHGRAHYRCRFPNEYAVGNNIDHPLTVYVRENAVLDPLDTWLAEAFAPDRIEQSLTALENAQPDHTPAVEAAQRAITECERKLARHRAALEAGADPALVVAWSQQVQQQRTLAQARLTTLTSHHGSNSRMSRDDIHAMVTTLGGLLDALRHADPVDKAEVYHELGVRLTYNHAERTVLAETRPTSSVCVVSVSEGGHQHGNVAHLPRIGVHVRIIADLVCLAGSRLERGRGPARFRRFPNCRGFCPSKGSF